MSCMLSVKLTMRSDAGSPIRITRVPSESNTPMRMMRKNRLRKKTNRKKSVTFTRGIWMVIVGKTRWRKNWTAPRKS